MKYYLLIIVLFFVVIKSVAQPPQNNPTNNSNSGNINFQLNSSANAEETNKIKADTLLGSDREESTILRANDTKKKSKEYKSEAYDQSEKQNLIQQKEVVSSSFNTTKKSATFQSNQRTPSPQVQQKLDAQVEEMKTLDPNSFEYNLFNYSAGNYDVNRENYLRNAEKLQPTNKEVLTFSAANAIVKGDTISSRKYLQQLEFQHQIKPETIDYTKDILTSTKDKSTLITHGFNDSYGAYQNQLNYGVKPSVDIVSMDFMQSQSYRKILSEKGYSIPTQKQIDVNYLKLFCEQNSNRNIAISMTFPKDYFLPIQDKIVPIGLVFEYQNAASYNSIEDLENLWFNELNKKVITNYTGVLSNGYAQNYIPMLLYLKNYYDTNQDLGKSTQIEESIQQIELKTGKKVTVKKKY